MSKNILNWILFILIIAGFIALVAYAAMSFSATENYLDTFVRLEGREMEITRVTTPEVLTLIIPHLVEDGKYNRQIIAKEILEMMVAAPDRICVITAFLDEELIGYTIGWVPIDREYVWLGQSWCGPKCRRQNGKKAIELVKQWAIDEHNIHEIRFETERNAEALTRAWGFNIHGYVMNCTF